MGTHRIHRPLLAWYRRRGRSLPWRDITDPYRILVSEMMLQQTQVSRVLVKYPEFLRLFPTFKRLAAAPTSAVITAWRGMGYNNRAIRLQQLARIVVEQRHGRLPMTIDALLELPGIGPYTAHAIASFASRAPVATVDTNIRRVLTRLFPRQIARMDIWDLAGEVLPRRRSYDWNQALMDLGAMICTAANPRCNDCPLQRMCPSVHRNVRVPSGKATNEPLVAGQPNRIYRGRIVELLRGSFPRSLRDDVLGVQILPDFTHDRLPWLRRLLEALSRDGIIRLRKRSGHMHASLVP